MGLQQIETKTKSRKITFRGNRVKIALRTKRIKLTHGVVLKAHVYISIFTHFLKVHRDGAKRASLGSKFQSAVAIFMHKALSLV